MTMWISAAEEPARKRGKKSPSSSSPPSLSSLPDEVVLSCVARTSRSDRAALSLVSRGYRSLAASPDLYKTRSRMGLTETYTYVCMRSCLDQNPRWYILRRGESENRLVRIQVPFCERSILTLPQTDERMMTHALPTEGSTVVALDWGIYVIGGLIQGQFTDEVWLLDCRTHTWRQAPSMRVERAKPAAGIVAGKIYVFGGCIEPDSSHWAEAFDPKTQTWETLAPMPDERLRSGGFRNTVVVREEKVYAVDSRDRSFYYSPSDGKWGRGNNDSLPGKRRDWCVVDKLIYCLDRHGRLWWCEPDELEGEQRQGEGEEEGIMYWREVNVLDSLKTALSNSRLVHLNRTREASWASKNGSGRKLIDLRPGARLSSSGGSNIVLFWDVLIEGDRRRLEIWSADISLERRQGGEIWGSVERSNALKTVDQFIGHDYKVLHSVSVSL
ncbi:unnamed protein product [Microthlaspi erraticum]|uniref:F-box domain-containing protein n=1 Tax=Microthlaspi erraticum TaxID=1685480 RepID=A0A6D2KJ29_9BRAS|nr:unnamed protein product [Microthlaspi erraticum]